MSIYLRSKGKGLKKFVILISSKFYLNTNSSPVAPLRRETDICAQGLFYTKFDSLQLLSSAFFMGCVFSAAFCLK